MDTQMISVLGVVVSIIGIGIGIFQIINHYKKTRPKVKTWDDIVNAFKVLEPKIREINPDVIVGLADGRVIGALIAVNLRMELLYSIDIRKDRKGGTGPVLGEVGNIEGKKVWCWSQSK